ncbi:MAG: BTAD domain-containing putative transcriptional regulator [Anaerolineae bacterium]
MARLNLSFLGSFEVRLDGQVISQFRSTNIQGLLLYLSLQPDRAFSRTVLATLFWPEEAQAIAKHNLRQSLYNLKKLLPDSDDNEPFLQVTRHSIRFNPNSDYLCDVQQFEERLSAGDFQQSINLYQGELAPGFTADSLEFEEWMRLEREYLHAKALTALKELSQQNLALRNYLAAQAVAQQLLQLDPWNEQAYRNLMLSLALSGDRSGALVAYDNCVTALYEELGIDPEPETIELSEKIEMGELDSLVDEVKSEQPKSLNKNKILDRLEPLQEQKLFGIERPFQQTIEALMANKRPWLIALDGLGGIGKTTLANEVVHHFLTSNQFQDIAWVSAKQEEYVTGKGIRATSKPALDPEACVDQLLAQLADGPYPANHFEAKRMALHQILQEKRSLVVIDNLETVADYEALLPLLRFLSRPSKILITTRMSLRDESDIFCLNLSELPQAEAIKLLKHEAKTQQIDQLLFANTPLWDDIYRTIGGNPLALKLVVGQAHYLPIEQILSGLRHTSDSKISDLYVYIYWQAWQMLDENSRKLFICLPMVPNGTFAQLAIASGIEAANLSPAIEKLQSLSLVGFGANSGQPRYRIHRLTETFLLHEVIKWQQPKMAVREPEGERFEERLTVVLNHWQTERKVITIDVEELDAEKEGILKAIHFGLDFEPSWPLVKELISALTGYMERRGHWAVWHDTLVRAIEVAQRLGDVDGELVIANCRGRILQRLSRPDELIQNYRRVIRLARKAGNQIEEGRACSNLGYNLIYKGQYWRAEVLNQHALKIFNQIEFLHGQAHTYNHLGLLYIQTGEWEKSEQHLNTACDIWQSNNDLSGCLQGLINLGYLFNTQGAPQNAIFHLNQALEIIKEKNVRGEWPAIYLNLSTSMKQVGNYIEAERYARLSETEYQNLNNFSGVYQAQTALGIALREQSKWGKAEKYFNSSVSGFRSIKDREWEMRVES